MTPRLALLSVLLLLAACGRDDGARATDQPAAEPAPGQYVAAGLPSPYDAGDVLRMTVREGEVSVQATCNTFSGTADWSAGTLRVSDLGGTEIGCPRRGFAQDEWLTTFLTSEPAARRDGPVVVLTGLDDVELRLRPA